MTDLTYMTYMTYMTSLTYRTLQHVQRYFDQLGKEIRRTAEGV